MLFPATGSSVVLAILWWVWICVRLCTDLASGPDHGGGAGNGAFKEKDFKEAVIYYLDAIGMNRDNATYYNNHAMAYLELAL